MQPSQSLLTKMNGKDGDKKLRTSYFFHLQNTVTFPKQGNAWTIWGLT